MRNVMKSRPFVVWPLLAGLLLLALGGCASLPLHVHKPRSEAFQDIPQTSLGRDVEAVQAVKSLSGIRLLASGDEALSSLIALADHAERTLDIQYYIINQDDSTRTLLHHVRLAADRGVRVRLLVDDLNTVGEDRRFMHLSQRANVEVRVFNPFPAGRLAIWTRFLFSAFDIPRINHRMHNKLFVADNALAITGGRNLGDAYFTRDLHSNFIDLDVVAAGEIVPELSATFDAFWNSKFSYPIASVASSVDVDAKAGDLIEATTAANSNWLTHELDAHALQLTWVPAKVLADNPAKIASGGSPNEQDTVANDIATLMTSAKTELIIISPYFVPGKDGVALMKELTGKGVHVRILTNSLASTDSPLVHTGYSRYRVALLKLGVDLREVRAMPGQKRRPLLHPFRSSNESLHAKAMVIDQKTVFVGSMNMDARSAHTNSELGLVIRSSDVAHQITALLDDISTDGSYRLSLDADRSGIRWSLGEASDEKVWHREPETTRTQRLYLKLLSPFAPEELL